MAINSIESFNVEGFGTPSLGNDALSHVYTRGPSIHWCSRGPTPSPPSSWSRPRIRCSTTPTAASTPPDGPGRVAGRGLREVACLLRSGIGLQGRLCRPRRLGPPRRDGPPRRRPTASYAGGLSDALAAFHEDLGPLMNEVTW